MHRSSGRPCTRAYKSQQAGRTGTGTGTGTNTHLCVNHLPRHSRVEIHLDRVLRPCRCRAVSIEVSVRPSASLRREGGRRPGREGGRRACSLACTCVSSLELVSLSNCIAQTRQPPHCKTRHLCRAVCVAGRGGVCTCCRMEMLWEKVCRAWART